MVDSNKKTQHRNLKISAQIGSLTFLAQVRYFIEKKKKLQYLKIQTRTIQGWMKENLKKPIVFSKILNTKNIEQEKRLWPNALVPW